MGLQTLGVCKLEVESDWWGVGSRSLGEVGTVTWWRSFEGSVWESIEGIPTEIGTQVFPWRPRVVTCFLVFRQVLVLVRSINSWFTFYFYTLKNKFLIFKFLSFSSSNPVHLPTRRTPLDTLTVPRDLIGQMGTFRWWMCSDTGKVRSLHFPLRQIPSPSTISIVDLQEFTNRVQCL